MEVRTGEGMSVTQLVDVAMSRVRRLDLICAPEWTSLCKQRHNVLLKGPEESTEDVLRFLAPYLRSPVLWRRSHAPFALPTGDCGALVVPNVAALGRKEQSELRGWIDDPNARRQVVSTTVDPLFPLVGRGLFDEALYYRLNVILLCVEWDGATQ